MAAVAFVLVLAVALHGGSGDSGDDDGEDHLGQMAGAIFLSERMGNYGDSGQRVPPPPPPPPPNQDGLTTGLGEVQPMPPSSAFPCADDWSDGEEAGGDEEMASDAPYVEQLKRVEVVADPGLAEECGAYTASHGFECVPYYLCDEDGVILTDGAGVIDIRFGLRDLQSNATGGAEARRRPAVAMLDATDKKCQGSLDVCCQNPDWEGGQDGRHQPDYDYEFLDPATTTAPPEPEPEYRPQCGRHNEFGLGVRLAGYREGETQFAEWPHMCAVLSVREVGGAAGETVNMFQCGGSLIAPGVVLTAAHCAEKLTEGYTKVRCGEWDTQTKHEPKPFQDRNVSHVSVHPEFVRRNLANDLALLFTAEDFDLDEHVDTVCLPDFRERFEPGETCWVTGWGKDEFGDEGEYQVVLKEVDVPMWDHAECQQALRRHRRIPPRFRLHQSFSCAGGEEGKDACKGDGGSPLVCPLKEDPQRLVQAGVVAWGLGCGDGGVPGVYASVAEGACWIDYAATCRLGEAVAPAALPAGPTSERRSYFGYGMECDDWLEEKVPRRVGRRRRGRRGRNRRKKKRQFLPEPVRVKYEECRVKWLER